MSAIPGWQPTIVAPLPTDDEDSVTTTAWAGGAAVQAAGPASGVAWLGRWLLGGGLVFLAGVAAWPAWSRASTSSFALVWLAGLVALGYLAWRWQASARQRANGRRRQAERLRVAEAALQATRARLLQHDQAVSRRAERARMLRELHDSVGGRLVAALALAQQIPIQPGALLPDAAPGLLAELRHQVEASLLELRLSLDHLDDGAGSPLVQALADLRDHAAPMLADAGIRLVWELHGPVEEVMLGAHTTLQLQRIAQEALSNIARHARDASEARLLLELLDGETGRHLRLAISDDGHPPGPAPTEFAPTQPPLRSGLGWARLQRQATELGAQLVAGAQARGWTVDLVLPLPSGR
jgi:hypothetical protein